MYGFFSTVLAKAAVMLIEALLMRVIQTLVVSLARTGSLQAA
ncbi:hypothetical protein [Streptosporangium amethystogenes]|nr:hypothetical protein [Streptosporangium amethystogenes]